MKKNLILSALFALALSSVTTQANVGRWFKKHQDVLIPVGVSLGAGALGARKVYQDRQVKKRKDDFEQFKREHPHIDTIPVSDKAWRNMKTINFHRA